MAEELQKLLDKINEEGVKKAEVEKDKIIADAKKKAAEIIADAQKSAAEVKKKSEADAERNEKRAADTIRQASRDIMLALKDELQSRLKAVVKECVGEAMTPEVMGRLVQEMEKSFLEGKSGADVGVEVLLSKKDLEKMDKLFKGSLGKNLKSNPDFSLGHDLTAGLKIGFKGNDLFFDFSDNALAEMICAYIGPRLATIISEEK